MKAVGLWRMQVLGAVTLELKGPTRVYKVDVQGAVDADGARVPVLPNLKVCHLKRIYEEIDGQPFDCQRIIHEGSKQLLHDTAALGAYTWEAFTRGWFVRLDIKHVRQSQSFSSFCNLLL